MPRGRGRLGLASIRVALSAAAVACAPTGACSKSDPPAVATLSQAPAAVSRTTGGGAVPAAPAFDPPPPRTGPVRIAEATAAHDAVQTAMWDGPLPDSELVHFTPVARGTQAAFHAALRALAAGERDRVRVVFYGASSVAGDRYTAYLRRYLQHRFGDGGMGFAAVVPLWRWHRHDVVRLEANTKQWRIEHAQRKTGKLDGRYGLLGASAHATSKWARTKLWGKRDAAEVHRAELWFLAQPGGGTAKLTWLGHEQTLDTKAEAPRAAYLEVRAAKPMPPALELAVAGDGEVRVFGAVFERDDPGVVVDELGIGGTRAANHVLWDEPIWREQIQRRAPDLWILAYGANEAVDEDEPIEVYRESLEAVMERFARAVPDASCLLLGPVDFRMEDEQGEWVERPRCTEILEIQREVAAAHGCAFFDLKAMMGGADSMNAWVEADEPLAKPDHLHLTPLGYMQVGRTLTDAIMADYDDPPPGAPSASPRP